MANKTVTVVGGDLRQLTVAKELLLAGYSVKLFLWDESFCSGISVCSDISDATNADILILPMPACIGSKICAPFSESVLDTDNLLENLKQDTKVFGGSISASLANKLRQRKIKYFDYLLREELALKNAVATAEGALEIAIDNTPITIHNSKCVVTGYGRIGKLLARMLKNLKADVTVSARRTAARAEAEVDGFKAVDIPNLADVCANCDIIFNTVPALLFDSKVLKATDKKALLIDLASKPGGVDITSSKDCGINVITALGLPGKCAPVTSGKIIFEAICNILFETEV